MPFADVERLAVSYLGDRLGVRVVTDLPARLAEALPVLRVLRAGGPDDRVSDYARLDVDTFAGSRSAMWLLAEQAREAMHELTGRVVNGQLVDSVTTEAGPAWVDYGNPAIWRAAATYRLTHRRT